MKLFIYLFIFSMPLIASDFLKNNIKKMTWNGVEVVWLRDNSNPSYNMTTYFGQGALIDEQDLYGQLDAALTLLNSGTTSYTQEEIADYLEYFGAELDMRVTHEYATHTVKGLAKDIVPTMKFVCHLFNHTTYPAAELKNYVLKSENYLNNLVTNHGKLADRIFREVTLKGTPIQKPVEGTIKSLKKLNPQHLKTTLTKLNKEVYKRIYITGPDKIKELEQVIKNDCGWQERIQNKQKVKLSQKLKGTPLIYLVPVPSANQAQIRIGRYMTESEAQGRQEFKQFAGSFLGGGFTSQLMQELRLKRGLTYSASAYISSQGGYGRSGINTFTKNETLKETLDVIKEVLAQNSKKIDKEAFEHFKRYLKGNYLFGLESNSAFINQLINNDHLERSYAEIYQFPNVIESAKKEDIRKVIDDIFKWEEQVILVVGDKSLQSELEKIGKVQILKYQDYL